MIPLVMANETGTAHRRTAGHPGLAECGVWKGLSKVRTPVKVQLDSGHSP